MKRNFFSIIALLILCLCLVACTTPSSESSNDSSSDISEDVSESESQQEVPPDIDGVITEEVGSISDYAGFWMAPDDSLDFHVLELMEGGEINCYDEDGNIIDTGFALYSEQDAITGLPLIRIILDTLGDFSSSGGNPTTGLHVVKEEYWAEGTDNDRDLDYFESSPFES